jgi:hypothetical protein
MLLTERTRLQKKQKGTIILDVFEFNKQRVVLLLDIVQPCLTRFLFDSQILLSPHVVRDLVDIK